MDIEIAQSTVARPTAAEVQKVWAEVLELWNFASEEEREELLQCIVDEVIVNEKNSVSLHLSPIAKNSELTVRVKEKDGSGDALRQLAPIVLAAWMVRRYQLAKNGRHGL